MLLLTIPAPSSSRNVTVQKESSIQRASSIRSSLISMIGWTRKNLFFRFVKKLINLPAKLESGIFRKLHRNIHYSR